MKFIRKKINIILIIFFVLLIIGVVTLKTMLLRSKEIASSLDAEEVVLPIKEEKIKDKEVNNELKKYVDIKGAILNPGVYELEINTRVIDIINKAGGLLENANTKNINLAYSLNDQDVIIIPTFEEVEKEIIPSLDNDATIKKENNINNKNNSNQEDNSNNDIILDLNTCTLEELANVPGIGNKKAEEIIKYRDTNNGFKNVEELKEINGIGDKTFEKIKSYFKVSN